VFREDNQPIFFPQLLSRVRKNQVKGGLESGCKTMFLSAAGKGVTNTGMKTVHAVYEQGVFRPTERVELPEHCEVEFEPRPVAPNGVDATNLAAVYDVLSERYESGESDVAKRHNEHQP
jgi:predicted DNA-binding antitoxin AbrB/MazE fold protein